MNTKIVAIVLALVITGCNTETKKENAELKEQAEQLKLENEGMRKQVNKLEASLKSYKTILTEIDNNLKAVDKNATLIGKLGKEGKDPTARETILARIAVIKSLLDNSKLKVLALDKSLIELRKKYGDQSEEVLELSREIKMQTRMIIEKENEFLLLRSSLEDDMEELKESYDQQLAITNQLAEIINRAYLFTGDSKTLKSKGIVEMEGGFIGIGRVKILNANSTDKLFTQIKKDQSDTLRFASSSAKLVTDHAENSYKISEAKGGSQLIITNKETFWKNGNYLVVETK